MEIIETRNVGFLTSQLNLSLPDTNMNFAFLKLTKEQDSPFTDFFKTLNMKYRIDSISATLGSDQTAPVRNR